MTTVHAAVASLIDKIAARDHTLAERGGRPFATQYALFEVCGLTPAIKFRLLRALAWFLAGTEGRGNIR